MSKYINRFCKFELVDCFHSYLHILLVSNIFAGFPALGEKLVFKVSNSVLPVWEIQEMGY